MEDVKRRELKRNSVSELRICYCHTLVKKLDGRMGPSQCLRFLFLPVTFGYNLNPCIIKFPDMLTDINMGVRFF
jgi:hypothetical protein